jgi:hypothetical protein
MQLFPITFPGDLHEMMASWWQRQRGGPGPAGGWQHPRLCRTHHAAFGIKIEIFTTACRLDRFAAFGVVS